MQLQKTAKAQEELLPGKRSLPLRQRSLLLMVESHDLADLRDIFGQEMEALLEQLMEHGYLRPQRPDVPVKPRSGQSGRTAHPALSLDRPEPAPAASVNLASTRMYLFDMCERLFANRHEDKAQAMREMLRQARDLSSLQAAARVFLHAVREHAGEERAAGIRQRLSLLLAQA
ncbi:hypothetical protein [Comamonas composti]|uniref:hypothetical protein n=1 Tax=Comamonas composti TaxID=408558 RepID=UPI0003F73D3E|nr:hypothetical protein [Comamonas composti]